MNQQGDVLFFSVKSLPKKKTKVKPKRKGLCTFAEGEVTGHHHSCKASDVILYEDENGTMWCDVKNETDVTHQEHNTVTLSPGKYKIGIVREIDPFEREIQKVQD